MKEVINPFEFEAANNLTDEEIIGFYIEDHNYTRFIRSTKNIFLVGERGSGKTMTLLYNSFNIQYLKSKQQNTKINFEKIGIHVPCNTPLFHKKEYLLLEEEHKKYIICEHYLVLTILQNFAKTLGNIEEIQKCFTSIQESEYEDLSYIWGTDKVFRPDSFFKDVRTFVKKEVRDTQQKINTYGEESFYENSYSFSSLLLPFFDFLENIDCLRNSHYLIMIDDAHDMNEYQIKTLNSWIAYRDHSTFSFKVAVAQIKELDRKTSSGGNILEGHDYLSIEMGKSMYGKNTEFYDFAKDIIEKRIIKIGLENITAEEFFPTNETFLDKMEECKNLAREEAESNGITDPDKITEYVKKYHRAIYYRTRDPKANNPPYSGFETLVHLSTGIVRNLLDPCYWMFDKIANSDNFNIDTLRAIDPAIQNSIIQKRSEDIWSTLRKGLDKIIEDCTKEQSDHIYILFNNLMVLFKKRLLAKISEPRAIVFSLKGRKELKKESEYIDTLLSISIKAQILYTRIGTDKTLAGKTIYYVPNRMLFPNRGLDVKGQASHVQIQIKDLYDSITEGRDLYFFDETKRNKSDDKQYKLDL